MRSAQILLPLVAIGSLLPAAGVAFQQPALNNQGPLAKLDESAFDEKTLRDAKLTLEGPALLNYFRDRTGKEQDPKKLTDLIQQLGDGRFIVRERAYAELMALGSGALTAVKDAFNHTDQEVRLRASELHKRIEERAEPALQAAVARLVGLRQPEGAAEVLLGYLPFAADDWVVEEICKALAKTAVRDGKAEPAVVAALTDPLAIKRGAAGAAVVAAGVNPQFPAARALLNDPVPTVRLRIALALLQSGPEIDAVAVLIDSLRTVPSEKSWQAEELLRRIAGETAPRVSLGTDELSRKACFAAWDKWWKDNQQRIDLAKVDFNNMLLGFTLFVYQTPAKAGIPLTFCLGELDAAKNVRWSFSVFGPCSDAQVLGPDRVLAVERNAGRVTEFDFKGNIKWKQNVTGPILSAQRLPSGNTFVILQYGLVEYDPTGKVVYSFGRRPQNQVIYRGRKMRNGDVVYATSTDDLVRLDSKTNQELSTFKIGRLGNTYGTIEELPNGNLLMPLYLAKRVVEYTPHGKEAWSVGLPQPPCSATRLPSGNTLVAFTTSKQIVEYDRNHREVWSHVLEGAVYVARKR